VQRCATLATRGISAVFKRTTDWVAIARASIALPATPMYWCIAATWAVQKSTASIFVAFCNTPWRAATAKKIASRASAKTLVLTHHRPRKDERLLDQLAEEVARDLSGHIVLAEDLTEIDL
jgi:hypothetical protein